IYRNGSLALSVEVGERELVSGLPFRIGSDGSGDIMTPYPGTWITGAFDDFAFYDQPLTAQQVASAFRQVAPEGVIPDEGSITILDAANGSATVDVSSAAGGETVTLTASPDEGYHLGEWDVITPADLIISG